MLTQGTRPSNAKSSSFLYGTNPPNKQICLVLLINVYLDHLKFWVVCINGRRYVCCSECNAVYNEPTSCLEQPISSHGGEFMYLGCVCFRGELGFLNCDDICMCIVDKQFELIELVFDSVYVGECWMSVCVWVAVG